jgi:hypothetical protein
VAAAPNGRQKLESFVQSQLPHYLALIQGKCATKGRTCATPQPLEADKIQSFAHTPAKIGQTIVQCCNVSRAVGQCHESMSWIGYDATLSYMTCTCARGMIRRKEHHNQPECLFASGVSGNRRDRGQVLLVQGSGEEPCRWRNPLALLIGSGRFLRVVRHDPCDGSLLFEGSPWRSDSCCALPNRTLTCSRISPSSKHLFRKWPFLSYFPCENWLVFRRVPD